MSSTILTVSDAARLIGCSAQTVRELERKGELRAMRTDAGWRLFHRDDVLRFVEERARRRDRQNAS